jgi:ATP-dependent exoDNAse (exonuclease V) beta subunit
MPSKQTILWVKPQSPPFDELGILPVKYGSELSNTIFKENYYDEKYSVYLDNLNLLYVALTRARDALYGFSVENPRSENSISVVLKNAFISDKKTGGGSMLNLHSYYNSETYVFEYGEIPENKREESANPGLKLDHYKVTQPSESLKLKLHGENYFSSEEPEVRKKINYGKLMHEVFEGINIPADISAAVRKLVLEGKLPENESYEIENRINSLISSPQVAEWFMQGNEVLTEAGILLPSGTTRRPDRVILRNGKATIIDFKFGEENDHYLKQVDQYRSLLGDMGYNNVDAFLWYVDKHKIVSV